MRPSSPSRIDSTSADVGKQVIDDATRDKIKAARTSMTELKDVTKDANSTIWVTPTFFSQLRKDAAQKQLQENESKPQ